MKISRSLLDEAVQKKIISQKASERLYAFFEENQDGPNFNLTNIIYYFGGLLAIGAMTLFMNLGWEMFGGWGIFFLSLLYGLLGVALTLLFKNKNLTIPAGICATFVICITPLAIYGLQNALGWWPDDSVYREYHSYIHWPWIFMEFGTLVIGVIMAWIFQYPFMIMPISITLWYMSMDLAVMFSGIDYYNIEIRALVSMYFGIITLLIAVWVDYRKRNSRRDYAFWLYLFGVIMFWGGMSCQDSDSELSKFIYLCINIVMIIIGAVLIRKVFVVFGALGCAMYFGHLAWEVFADSAIFPIALTAIGILIIFFGTWWQKNETWLRQKFYPILPKFMQDNTRNR